MIELAVSAFELQPVANGNIVPQRLRIIAERLDGEAHRTIAIDTGNGEGVRLAQASLQHAQETELTGLGPQRPPLWPRRNDRCAIVSHHLGHLVAARPQPGQKLRIGVAQDP
ncbi:hypothetical protein D3C87_1893230 [compost metagenome]